MSPLQPPFSPLRLARAEIWILLALVLGCRLISIWELPLDDEAFITFRYARNWAAGLGLVYNPGEPWEPVLGTSSPGFAALLALFLRLGCDPTWVAPALDLVCDLASAWLLLEILDRRRSAGGAALFAFALLPQLDHIGAGGTEAPLFTALALGSALALQRERWSTSGTLAALATLVRPEGLLLVALLAGHALRSRAGLRRLALPVALIGGVALAWLLGVYGDVLPQPLRVSLPLGAVAGGRAGLARAWDTLRQAFCPQLLCLPLLPLVLFGLARSFRRGTALSIVTLCALLISAGYVAARVPAGFWYFHLPLSVWCAWLGQGFAALVVRLHARLSVDTLELARQRAIVFGGPLLLLAFGSVAAARREPIDERVYGPLQSCARAIGRVEPRARILAADIGALGWAWRGTVFDSEGRTWPQAALYGDPNRMIRELRPEYLLIDAERRRVEHFYADRELCERYVPVARFSASGASELELELDLERLPRSWVPDYLLYRRRDLEDGLAR
jgi:hypothetical protein